MNDSQPQLHLKPWAGPKLPEFVALMAALMAAPALAIDAMLPALPAIGESLAVAEENERQLVVTAFLLGFGLSQIFYGPLSDRLGRKTILTASLLAYGAMALASALAASFPWLLAARFGQGMAAAGLRVLVISIVRDRFEGAGMARVMSLTFIVFMIIPVLAPAFGQAVLWVAEWRFIFIGLGAYAAAVLGWALIRLPETHPPERRRPLSFAKVREALATILGERLSIGNTLALTLVMGALFGFINSIQQITGDAFGRPELLALVFAAIAGPMALSSWLNSRIVERLGSRPIMLAALGLFAALSAVHLAATLTLGTSLSSFILMLAVTLGSFGLIAANLGATAMQPLGHIAGTGSAVQGLITTTGGALIGLAIGQAYAGSPIPLLAGFTLCGTAALAVALWANRERPG
ncbi:MAG: multidrug effflux MFS transporter [Sphingomonadaceae bacterium]